jgi:hypothetical protein
MAENSSTANKQQIDNAGSGAAAKPAPQLAADAVRQSADAMAHGGRAELGVVRGGTETVADTIRNASAATGETVRRSTLAVADGTRQIMSDAVQRSEALPRVVGDAVQEATAAARDLAPLPQAANEALTGLQHTMSGVIEGLVASNVRVTQELFRLTSPGMVIAWQQRFFREYLDAMLEGSATMVRAARRTTDQSLQSLEDQLTHRREALHSEQPQHGAAG